MTVDVTAWVRAHICCWISNPKLAITIAWFLSLICVFGAVVMACVLTNQYERANNRGSDDALEEGHGQAAIVAVMWTVTILVIVSAMGTYVMQRSQTAMSMGYFLGVIFVLCNQMLILHAVFAERSVDSNQSAVAAQVQRAMATFCFFLFAVYGLLTALLAIFRDDVIKEEIATAEEEVVDFR